MSSATDGSPAQMPEALTAPCSISITDSTALGHPLEVSRHTPVIDHTAYPQIMDIIFGAASGPLLVAFRATCRTYRDRVKAVLAKHLALTDTHLLSALSRTPHRPCFPPAALDCFEHFALQPSPHVADAAGAPILRIRDAPLTVIDAIAPSTVVVYGWLRPKGEELPEARLMMLGSSRRRSPVEHCSTVRKVVIVIDGVPNYTCYANGMVSAWPSITDITVLYVPKEPATPHGKQCSGSDFITLDTKFGNILCEVFPPNRSRTANPRLTLVNADAIPVGSFPSYGRVGHWARSCFNPLVARGPYNDDNMLRPMSDNTLRKYVHVVHQSRVDVYDTIRFLSLDEYEAEVGAEAFALETDPTFALR
ncbi:hypothetical protein CC85DRAFT_292081 [Cutaneotrichosporon oleaginosum]|uniref:Uncharacterized protein n=1 Tax=Cutaneotrichosporon oleaginosum TaxID=879819 RepID=A0A0J0XMX2_9TREE|nr:uncharacterized protein CC85DRAFT_292081 [Cutaneotrichosporon oleaginosum]KLT42437.1 hypothetical protein CC85DRAFT_292081 [Cutaneotrichosporon oleaginosum]TXT06956.1 hypothetical protein COLE_06287 [Cutaneotrichosporon oleaginosum]